MRMLLVTALAFFGATILAVWTVVVSMDFAFGPGLMLPLKLSDLTDTGVYYPITYLLPVAAGALIYLSLKVGRAK